MIGTPFGSGTLRKNTSSIGATDKSLSGLKKKTASVNGLQPVCNGDERGGGSVWRSVPDEGCGVALVAVTPNWKFVREHGLV